MGELIKNIQTDNSTKLQMERNNISQIYVRKDHKCQKRVTFVFIYFFHQFKSFKDKPTNGIYLYISKVITSVETTLRR